MGSGLGKAARRFDSALTLNLEGRAHPLPPKKIKKALDKSQDLWYNKGVKRRENVASQLRSAKTLKKKCWKPLDKSPSLCYNKDVNEGSKAEAEWQDPRESDKTLTIKSSTARCSCLRNINVNQTSQAETMSRIRRIQKPLGHPR